MAHASPRLLCHAQLQLPEKECKKRTEKLSLHLQQTQFLTKIWGGRGKVRKWECNSLFNPECNLAAGTSCFAAAPGTCSRWHQGGVLRGLDDQRNRYINLSNMQVENFPSCLKINCSCVSDVWLHNWRVVHLLQQEFLIIGSRFFLKRAKLEARIWKVLRIWESEWSYSVTVPTQWVDAHWLVGSSTGCWCILELFLILQSSYRRCLELLEMSRSHSSILFSMISSGWQQLSNTENVHHWTF